MTSVLHIAKSAGIGGSERHLLSLLPALGDRGVEARAIILAAPGAEVFVAALRDVGVEVSIVRAGPDLNPAVIWRLRRELGRRKPDLVHTHLIHADIHGQIACRGAGVPGVSSVHSVHGFYRREPYRSAARIAGHLAQRTIAISNHVGEMLIEAKVVRPERVRVVHYGLDGAPWELASDDVGRARQLLALAPEDVMVGIASRLIAGKGHDALIQAVALASRRGVRLRMAVAGDGPIRLELEELVRSEGIEADVTFLGFVGDIAPFMAACDVVAFPTQPELGEGFGLAALEAMVSGKPVVATRVASLPEVVVDGETGLLVEPGNIEGLTDALVRLAVDKEMRLRLGSAGRRRAAERFSLQAMLDGTLAVYQEVLVER